MKKLLYLSAIAAMSFTVLAQEPVVDGEQAQGQQTKVERKEESATWPAFLAVGDWPRSADVVGLRLTIPFSRSQENVTGIDVGFWGKSIYFEGLQVNILRNNVIDGAAGFQVGIYNSVGRGDMLGLQAGLWNEAMSFRGFQVGLVNLVGEGQGFQIGVVNRAETLYGYQIGVINVIRDAELQFMPLLNIGF